MTRRILIGMLGIVLSWSGQAAAEDAVTLDQVLVSLRRVPGLTLEADEYPGHATVVTAEEIKRAGATNVPDLLARYAGLFVTDSRSEGLGAEGTVNLRGVVNSSRSNVLVLVDGVKQNRVTGDEVHWPAIPVEQIERIEVLRGGGGMIYGEGALAGVINIITKRRPDRVMEGETGVEFGSFGHQRYHSAVRGAAQGVRYGVSYTRALLDGYRDDSSFRATTIRSFIGWDPLEATAIDVTTTTSRDTTNFAGGITSAVAEADRRHTGSFPGFSDEETNEVSLQATQGLPAGFTLTTQAFFRARDADSATPGRFETLAPSKGLSVRGSHEGASGFLKHTLIAGADLLDEKATTGTRGTSPLSESNRTGLGFYAEETLRLWGRLSLVGGFRYDRYRYEEDLTFPAFAGTLRFQGRSPKLGVTLDVTPDWALYTSYARSFKAPNIDDLDAVLPPFNDSVDVKPQTADTYEVGARWHRYPWLAVDADYFLMTIDDEILFDNFSFKNANFDTRRRGLELELRGAYQRWLQYYATYTFTQARFWKGEFTGYRLPLTPEHRGTLGVSIQPAPQATVWADWVLVSTQFRVNDFFNRLPADNYGYLNVGVRYTVNPWTAYVTVNNATNEEYGTFQSSNGTTISTGENPAPPMHVIGGLRLTF